MNIPDPVLDALTDGLFGIDRDHRIVDWNRAAEQISGYSAPQAQSFPCCNSLLNFLHEDGEFRCGESCMVVRALAAADCWESDGYILHRQGYRVPVQVQVFPDPPDSPRAAHGVIHAISTVDALQARINTLSEMAMTDPLTGLANRRYAEEELERSLDRFRRYGHAFGVVFMDIDHFKTINDGMGHDAGDALLHEFANNLMLNTRTGDVVARWGGEEFLAIVHGVDAAQLQSAAERLRYVCEKAELRVGEQVCRVTLSAGATLMRHGDSTAALVKRADRLMYDGKQAGRNRVVADV